MLIATQFTNELIAWSTSSITMYLRSFLIMYQIYDAEHTVKVIRMWTHYE